MVSEFQPILITCYVALHVINEFFTDFLGLICDVQVDYGDERRETHDVWNVLWDLIIIVVRKIE